MDPTAPELKEQQRQNYIRLIEEGESIQLEGDKQSKMQEFPKKVIGGVGSVQAMLRTEQALPHRDETKVKVVVLDKDGAHPSTYDKARDRELVELTFPIINSGHSSLQNLLASLSLDGVTDIVTGLMEVSPFGSEEDSLLATEPYNWTLHNTENGEDEQVKAEFLMVPPDIDFLSKIGFRFSQTQGGEVN